MLTARVVILLLVHAFVSQCAPRVPQKTQKSKKAFTIPQSDPKPFIIPGPAALAGIYGKYNKVIPPEVQAAAEYNDGTINADPEEFDSQYLCPVNIGGQTFNLGFDSGSSDLWVYGTGLSAASKDGHSVYDPSRSNTSQKLENYSWKITYGDGSGASGDVFVDTVRVGTTIAKKQALGAAETIIGSFHLEQNSDGLLGLGFDSLNTITPIKQPTFFTNVKESLSAPLFTADLRKGKPGSFDFGFIDDEKYVGRISYIPVNNTRGFWEITSESYAIGNGKYISTTLDGIVDSGTTLLLLPSAIVSIYYGKVTGARWDRVQGGYIFPCSTTLPSFTLRFGTYSAVIPGSYMKYAPISVGSQICFGGMQRNSRIGFSIFGGIFMKSQFIVFDATGPQRIGLAKKFLP